VPSTERTTNRTSIWSGSASRSTTLSAWTIIAADAASAVPPSSRRHDTWACSTTLPGSRALLAKGE
jgi:hypothetical protein